MQLVKRHPVTGMIVSLVDTKMLASDDERAIMSDELHDLLVEHKFRQAMAITEKGIESQLDSLVSRCGEEKVIDLVLRILDTIDNRRALGLM